MSSPVARPSIQLHQADNGWSLWCYVPNPDYDEKAGAIKFDTRNQPTIYKHLIFKTAQEIAEWLDNEYKL